MLAAEAMRLAAVEALCPTASISTGLGFPTLAAHRVFDSRMIGVDELDGDETLGPFTPSLSLFREDVRIERRGEGAPSTMGGARATLVVIAELGVSAEGEGGEVVVVPYAESDAHAQLVLGALCAQVRKALVYAPGGSIFRSIVLAVEDVRVEPFALPQFDIRWMRSTMSLVCRIKDDVFTDDAGLPEPLRDLAARLPAGSYAAGKLAELDAVLSATPRAPLDEIRLSTKGEPTVAPEGSVPA